MREYRAKNRDRLRAYERERWKRRKGIKKEEKGVKEVLTTQKPKRCMAKDCDSTETTESSIAGMKAWLCKIHQQK